jgi:hypothetical protein
MNRRIDDRELVELLRHAGTDVELDVGRILSIVDGASPETRTHPIRRPIARLQRRSPLQLLALPMAAAVAVGLVLAVKGVGGPTPERIKIVTGRTATDGATPSATPTVTSTSKLGDAKSITAPTQPGGNSTGSTRGPAGGQAGGTASSAPTQASSGGTSIEVAPVRQGTAFRLPMHASRGWLLVGSARDGSQPHSNVGGVALGPAQVMGAGPAVEVGPYDVGWAAGSAGTSATRSGTWLTVPGIVRGVPSGLRIPVRVQRTPARITLLTGTVGGGGRVAVSVGKSSVTAELPSCTQAICPAVVTVTLDPTTQQPGITVMIELNGTGADGKVGLAAVELD